jgi:spore germination protein GerM
MRRICAVLIATALTGCGVPTGDSPHLIAPSDVPYGLGQAAPTSAAPPSTPAATKDARVFFMDAQDRLVARARDVGVGSREERLEELLGSLAAGPTEEELGDQLSTALRPDIDLSVKALRTGIVTVDVGGVEGAQNGGESRDAVAQIVLTATSLPWVDGVLIASEGETVEAPLPSGELTSAPLTADDYSDLVADPSPGE